MKKIYITGLGGMLGSNIAMELQEMYNVMGCDVVPVNFQSIFVEKLDLVDINKVKKNIADSHPDVIIHTAAMVNVDDCEMNKERARMMNTVVTEQLAQICFEQQIKLIYISTDAVFDGEKKGLYTEEDNVNPINIYGATKLAGEIAVMKQQTNVVLRTNIYGYNYQEKYSFGEWVLNSLLNGNELNMFGDIYFSPVLVNDLAHLIGQIIDQNVSGLYHACGTGAVSKYEFGCQLKEIFQIPQGMIRQSQSTLFPFKAKRAPNMGMSNKKLCDVLGVSIRTPRESIIEFKRLYDEKYNIKLKNL